MDLFKVFRRFILTALKTNMIWSLIKRSTFVAVLLVFPVCSDAASNQFITWSTTGLQT